MELLPGVPVEMKLSMLFFFGLVAVCQIANALAYGWTEDGE